MIFQIENYRIEKVSEEDCSKVLEVYNSNPDFLLKHLNKEKITKEWYWQLDV